MENFYLSAIVREIQPEVQGQFIARVAKAGDEILFDIRDTGERMLLASLDRTSPALYFARRDIKQIKSALQSSHPFFALLRKRLAGAKILALSKEPFDRIIRLEVERFDLSGEAEKSSLVLALTGRTTNAYLLDASGTEISSFDQSGKPYSEAQGTSIIQDFDPAETLARLSEDATQEDILNSFFGPTSIFAPVFRTEFIARCRNASPAAAFKSLLHDLFYSKPVPLVYSRIPEAEIGERIINLKTDLLLSHIELKQAEGLHRIEFDSLSEAADWYYSARQRVEALRAEYNFIRQLLARQIKKREAAMQAVTSDLARFEDPDRLKRFGDLILANLATARVHDSKATVIDYYNSSQPEIEIELGEGRSLQQAASDYFARYQKARRALSVLATRKSEVARELDPLKELLARLEEDPSLDRIKQVRARAERLLGIKPRREPKTKERRARAKEGKAIGRRFLSTDGYEIIVGRNDRENDQLTFRVARPNDLWLHAADYPGSHVVVRNPSREPLPHRAIIEAAEVAAFNSQAKREAKAAVHYTERKFVSKPPRAKPGLVRLSSFKTVMVEPRCNLRKIE
ncbi:MAG TPA: NFACT RNA binding domain-containing protein [Blastocatellia bacterium]|nr:NFACT RNA binding domain-containing protein [Blastocatellia bacterium]